MSSISLSSGLVVFLLGLIIMSLYGVYLYIKKYLIANEKLNNQSNQKYSKRNKYDHVNLENYRSIIFKLSLLGVILSTVVLLSWTTTKRVIEVSDIVYEFEDQQKEVVPPRTSSDAPPPPPPPSIPEEILKPIENLPVPVEKIEQPNVVENKTEVKNQVENSSSSNSNEPAPPAPPITPSDDEIFTIVEQMPRFPGCEELPGDNKAKEDCSKQKLKAFIYQNVVYPKEARDKKFEGQAYVSFYVNADGSVSNIKIVQDPGNGLGEAAKNVVEMMTKMPQKWTPGKHRGRPVKVRYTLPIQFKLSGSIFKN